MKNFILFSLLLIAGIIILAEPTKISFGIIALKGISLLYSWVFFKANDYFREV